VAGFLFLFKKTRHNMKKFKADCLCRFLATTFMAGAGIYHCRAQETLPIPGKAAVDTQYNDSRFQQWLWNKFNKTGYKSGFKPRAFFNNADRFHVGIGYEVTKENGEKLPFASQHGVYARYSISQNAVSVGYYGVINHVIGKWDLHLNADYDAIRWTNFYGLGNETRQLTEDRNYYRVRTREAFAGVGLNRRIGTTANLRFTPFYRAVKVINDEGRFLAETLNAANARTRPGALPTTFEWDQYAGLAMDYSLVQVDNEIVPRKGYTLSTGAAFTHSLDSRRSVTTVNGSLNFYLPLSRQMVFASRNGAATLYGDPKFYQMNNIGGAMNLRGYRRERFWGTTAFYTNNELQYLFDVKSKLFNGTIGPVAFYDIGRVWEPGESSRQWHSGYGGGFMIAPFNKVMFSVTYGMSNEFRLVHLSMRKAL
jgi:hypothetical protein